ncbi:putative membrane protein YkoI [Sphingomonas sp. UYAg733]
MKTIPMSLAAIALIGTAPPAFAAKVAKPKITMAQARTIALKRAPGRIKDAEYEFEKGGWRYSFDILQGKRIHEIGVNAMTGTIVEDAFEAPGKKD